MEMALGLAGLKQPAEKDEGEIWFVQERRFMRPYPVHRNGWMAGAVFVICFFALAGFFLSLDPFRPVDYGLLFLWWLSILALMLVYGLLMRPKTDRRWKRKEKRQ
jgi:hypothetical protein